MLILLAPGRDRRWRRKRRFSVTPVSDGKYFSRTGLAANSCYKNVGSKALTIQVMLLAVSVSFKRCWLSNALSETR